MKSNGFIFFLVAMDLFSYDIYPMIKFEKKHRWGINFDLYYSGY